MREGIYWRGRRWQQEYNPNQSFVLLSVHQARRRGAKVLTLCLILCFITWATSRFRTPSRPISTESLPHQQAPTRAIVFELFRYDRHPQLVRSRRFTAVSPVHQRRRGLLETDSEKTTASTPQEIFDDDEHEEQPFDGQRVDDDNQEYASCTRRKGCEYYDESIEINIEGDYDDDIDNTRAPRWSVYGGERESDLDINSFFIKVALGYGNAMQKYFMNIDTGSGITWVNCKGRGPIRDMGPNGVFIPKAESFLNCKKKPKACTDFQEGAIHPCNRAHKYRCLFNYEYADDTLIEGYVVEGDVLFDMSDGSQVQMSIPFGCADRVKDSETTDEDTVETDALMDGLIGLGPHQPSGWLQQLFFLGLISESGFAICLEPRIGDIDQLPGSSLFNHAGFLSFGDLFTTQAASTVWTRIIPPKSNIPEDNDPMYTAKLLAYKYRNEVVYLKETEERREGVFAVEGVEMGFDTGCDHTWLTPQIFHWIYHSLDQDAKRMGYKETQDAEDFTHKRKCWTKGSTRDSAVSDFADLVLMFSSPAGGDTTSDFVIEPKYFITSGGSGDHQRTCFNMHSEASWDYGNLGGEVMRGHLIIFDEQRSRIGWQSVTSCANLR